MLYTGCQGEVKLSSMTSSEVPRHDNTSKTDRALVQVSTPSHPHRVTPPLHITLNLYAVQVAEYSALLSSSPSAHHPYDVESGSSS